MINILIVLEDDDEIDFRDYSLQILNSSTDLAPYAKLHIIETEGITSDNTIISPSSYGGFQCNFHHKILQSRKALDIPQIFMN